MSLEDFFLYTVSALAIVFILAIPVLFLRGRKVMADNNRIMQTNTKIEENQRQMIANDTRRVAALEAIATSLSRIEAHLDTRNAD